MIRLNNVVKDYCSFFGRKKITAVDNVSLTINNGEVFTILGPNGAGKTTIIKMVCNLIIPTNGEIFVGDKNIRSYPKETMKMIGAVLEGSRNIFWRLTPTENCIYLGALRGIPFNSAKKRSNELLEKFGLTEKKDIEVRFLSRGMQQKTAICCALMADPPILLLDEPALGLDVETTNTLIETIKRFAIEDKKVVVITTHNMNFAQKISNRVAILNRGKVIKVAPVSDLLKYSNRPICEITTKGALSDNLIGLLGPLLTKLVINDCKSHIQIPMETETIFETIKLLKENKLVIESIKELEKDLESIFIDIIKTDKQKEEIL